METRIVTRNEFVQRYWKYYLMLEEDFLKTERYLTIDEHNYKSFSNEYIKQYQAICSEIDVIAKSYCKELDNNFRGRVINSYCKCITDNNPDFASRKIKISNRDIELFPWKDWSYTINEKLQIVANNPDWWQKYNRIKHTRTTTNAETSLPYYKLANQKNVLHSLSALYQLELYYYRKLHQTHFSSEPDMPGPASKIFEIDNWGNIWVMYGDNIGFKLA